MGRYSRTRELALENPIWRENASFWKLIQQDDPIYPNVIKIENGKVVINPWVIEFIMEEKRWDRLEGSGIHCKRRLI